MKWSTLLPPESIGIRAGFDEIVPLAELLRTISLAVQFNSKRQSCQTTWTFPAPSISAEGRGPERMPPATLCVRTGATVTVAFQLVPPLVEVKARIDVSFALAIGTITVPPGWTSGWPPNPVALLAVFRTGPQVRP